ncbi:hypothetical protein BDA99DRAFT_600336 [Phascolomyces articulosus]|uniref:Dilute domain-containing protein n=1 Tax=Phascolomyces articulosus TaxID=60185 RepID=A0AAD5KD17_9FUNG|nr:hypothetical protein BDA99DRAFT_600336 [Phascolomyces articulosus]
MTTATELTLPERSQSTTSLNNKRRCSGSALPGEHDQQRRRQRRPSLLCVLPPPHNNKSNTAGLSSTTPPTPVEEKDEQQPQSPVDPHEQNNEQQQQSIQEEEDEEDEDDYDDKISLRKTTRKNVCSWSSTSSCFSTASSLTSISTPITTTAAATLLNTTLPLDLDDDEEEEQEQEINKQNHQHHNETEHEMHQRQWRKRVSRSLGRSASNGDAVKVHQILTDQRLTPFLDIDAADDEQDGTTPLIYAACFGKTEVVQILLNAGAKVDVQDKRGWTALMWATTNNHSQVVELLLERGASSAAKSARGRTALDFIDTGNEQMIHIMSHLEEGNVSSDSLTAQTALRRRKSFRRYHPSSAPITPIASSHNNNIPQQQNDINNEQDQDDEDPLDFYYQNNEDTEKSHRELMQLGEQEYDTMDEQQQALEEDELASCEASMQSIHKFDWDKCLPDQMFVFSEENIQHILDTAITNLSLPMKTRQEIWVPANIIFLSARFAHYYSSRELLHIFLNAAIAKMNHVLQANSGDVHTLAFWMANVSQLLYYLKKDSGLVVATAEHQLELSELVCETYTLLIMDSEQRIDKILEPAMLEHEPIQGLTEQVDFADDWQRRFSFFYRRNSTRGKSNNNTDNNNNSNNHHHYSNEPSSPSSFTAASSSSSALSSPRTLSPQSITSLLSSILYVLQSYEVHPAIVLQAIAQFFHFLSCEMFNRILSNKKYLCRSKALQIRMNVTALEEWMRESQLPSHLASYFNPLVQLLQLLQCVSQLNELMLFVNTMKTFDVLNPLQIKRCVLNYRYEVSETRLPDEVNQYVMQIAEDTVRQQQQLIQQTQQQRASCDISRRDSSSSRSAVSRPTSVSSLGSLFMASVVGSHKAKLQLQQLQQQQQQQEEEEENDINKEQQQSDQNMMMTEPEEESKDPDGLREWTVEKRDSRYMLPFSLPTTSGWGKKVIPSSCSSLPCDSQQHQPPSLKQGETMSVSDAMCQEFKQKLSAEREKSARERGGIVPTIPEEWMDRLDNNLVS